jgi:hypothetical protein
MVIYGFLSVVPGFQVAVIKVMSESDANDRHIFNYLKENAKTANVWQRLISFSHLIW